MKKKRKHFVPNRSNYILVICLMVFGMFSNAYSQTYFQQTVNYTIKVSLNDTLHELSAFEKIEYINNSPDTLQFLYFHLWPNAYSNNETDLAKQLFSAKGKTKLFKDEELRGFIDSLDFKINNQPVVWTLVTKQPDICQIMLNKPLFPGESILITTPFHVKIPKGITSRLGHIGQSYQISQWFPKPAVYDTNGWHQMPYLDQGEFYSEFGSFDVSITLPENYIVGATGNLKTEEEIVWLEQLAADTTWKSNKKVKINGFPVSSTQMKTLHYTENNVHDFAWFADKRFHVLKSKVILPNSGREVATWLMFTNMQSKLWRDAIPYINRAILDFSTWVGDYPYNNFTAVQSALNAGLGMEYPGVTVIGLVKDAYSLDKVIMHEAGHNWFYAALASNERLYPFMDEGMTSTYEMRYLQKNYPDKKIWEDFLPKLKQAKFFHVDELPMQRMTELQWLIAARSNLEQPINLPATGFTSANYGQMIYNKAALGFNYLRAYLGDSLFDNIIQNYYRTWKFKHPQPENLRFEFESNSDKDLSWFFNDFIGTTKRLDYKVARLENQKLLIENNAELVSPLLIAGMIGDSVCFERWVEGFEGQKWIDIPEGNFTEFKIDPNHVMPELFRLNNNIKTKGLFPKSDPVQTQLLLSIDDPEKHSLMYIPAVNWNRENGFMLGVALHNGVLTPKPFQYFLLPLYAFKNSALEGYGKISYNITPYNQLIRLAQFSMEGTRFGAPGRNDYHKLMTGINIYLRPDKFTNSLQQNVYGRYILASDLYQIKNSAKATLNSYLQLGYNFQNDRKVNPYNLLVSLEVGKTHQKIAVNSSYKVSYNESGNGLEARLFAGTMLNYNTTNTMYKLAPSGRSGRDEYLYEGIYPDRFSVFPTTVFSRQMSISEGGLVSPMNESLGYSNWLVSLSLSSSFWGKVGKIGVKPFFNVLVNDHGLGINYTSSFFAETGLKVGVWNLLEIHIPLLVTNNIKSINPKIMDRVRLVFNLDISKLNNN